MDDSYRPMQHRAWSTCEATGKRGYPLRRDAKGVAKRTETSTGRRYGVYRCDDCGRWHVGHHDRLTIRGVRRGNPVKEAR